MSSRRIQHHVEDLPGGGREIVFPLLVPSQQVTITYVYFPPVTWQQINTTTRSDEGFAKIVTALPTPQSPARVLNSLRVLVVVGAAAAIYGLVLLIRGLWLIWSLASRT